ncbi:MAG TPA: hypothetical protein VJU59_09050 [Paraburkholderia sp.]|uniref:hypothetical protein n=1 Tax=Paraburkholderia sp. TaxID=1926495 RepID=UPI002B49FC43|nr:hypothetical protein [Paraburkholderia sp.]HKR39814.1 hypothetical protein [Paraburkholderia sp.]
MRLNPNLIACSLTLSVALLTHAQVAEATVNCDGLIPGGVKLSQQGEQKATVTAETLLKLAKLQGDVSNETKKAVEALPQQAPTDDPQALRTRALYLFCGMVANANDIPTERKNVLFNQLLLQLGLRPPSPDSGASVGGPPPPPPLSPKDLAALLGLPPIGSDKATVAQFAAEKNGNWGTTKEGRQFVNYDGRLHDEPFKVWLFFNSNDRLSLVSWVRESWRVKRSSSSKPSDEHNDGGPDPQEMCENVNKFVNYFVTKTGAAPSSTTTEQPALEAWGYFRGKPSFCGKYNDCHAEVNETVRRASLEQGSQHIQIESTYVHGSMYVEPGPDRYRDEVSTQCRLWIGVEKS